MKGLSYLKNKGRFLIAFVICCFALSCGRDRTNIDIGYVFDKVCLDGHVYYQGMGIKLDDNGKPVKCKK